MQECQLVMVIQHQVIGSLKTQNTISKRELVLHDADSADSVVPPLDAAWTWTPAGPAHATIWTCSSHNVGLFAIHTSRMASRPVSNNVFCGFLRTYYLVLYNHDVYE